MKKLLLLCMALAFNCSFSQIDSLKQVLLSQIAHPTIPYSQLLSVSDKYYTAMQNIEEEEEKEQYEEAWEQFQRWNAI